MAPKIIKSPSEMRAISSAMRLEGKRVVFVPTMGFLHDGHRELLKAGRQRGDVLVLSIFVNPAQFGPKEDLSSYPRDLQRDLAMASEEGVDIAFIPEAKDIYPPGFKTHVEVEGLSSLLCGAARPGHFRGVATVVLKLFNIVAPHEAVFGRKDYQQLKIIERLTADLNLPVEITGVDTVREADGLAMSSRNTYLNAEERAAAASIPRAIGKARAMCLRGCRKPLEIIDEMKKVIEAEPLAVIDYVKVCDPESLEDLDNMEGPALVALAVRIGRARLIDNAILP